MVLDLTSPLAANPWRAYPDLDSLTEEQAQQVNWWLPYRRMDTWHARGGSRHRTTRSYWYGPTGLTIATRRRWWAGLIHGWECWYCRLPLIPQIFTTDHLTPTCRGGSDTIENVRPACVSCNSRKGTRTEEEYRAIMSPRPPHLTVSALRMHGVKVAA